MRDFTRADPDGPTCGPDGRQLAPETFARWLIPGVWEDTDGAAHYDIPKLLELFEFQDTPENRELVTNTIAELIQEKLPNVTIVVRARTPEADT